MQNRCAGRKFDLNGREMGPCGWSEVSQDLMRLYDLTALLLCQRPTLLHVADLGK